MASPPLTLDENDFETYRMVMRLDQGVHRPFYSSRFCRSRSDAAAVIDWRRGSLIPSFFTLHLYGKFLNLLVNTKGNEKTIAIIISNKQRLDVSAVRWMNGIVDSGFLSVRVRKCAWELL